MDRGEEQTKSSAERTGGEHDGRHPAPGVSEARTGLRRLRAAGHGQANRKWRIPGAIVYWAMAAGLVVALLGLMTVSNHSLTQVGRASATAKAANQPAVSGQQASATDPTGGFNIFIVLGPERPQWHDLAWASDLESRLKEELAREGFPTIGVSVGRDGAVFLAGTLYRPSDKWEIEKIVERTPGVVDVYFPHPELQKLYGPGYLGVEAGPSPYRVGVKVIKVWAGSPAAMAGIRTGDIIVRFGGRRVNGPEDFHYLVASYLGGQRVPVVIEHGRSERHLTVRLGETSPVALD